MKTKITLAILITISCSSNIFGQKKDSLFSYCFFEQKNHIHKNSNISFITYKKSMAFDKSIIIYNFHPEYISYSFNPTFYNNYERKYDILNPYGASTPCDAIVNGINNSLYFYLNKFMNIPLLNNSSIKLDQID